MQCFSIARFPTEQYVPGITCLVACSCASSFLMLRDSPSEEHTVRGFATPLSVHLGGFHLPPVTHDASVNTLVYTSCNCGWRASLGQAPAWGLRAQRGRASPALLKNRLLSQSASARLRGLRRLCRSTPSCHRSPSGPRWSFCAMGYSSQLPTCSSYFLAIQNASLAMSFQVAVSAFYCITFSLLKKCCGRYLHILNTRVFSRMCCEYRLPR